MSKKFYRTDHLFPRTNTIIGAGSIFNIAGNYFSFNYSDSSDEADSKAIESDWGTIGQDLKKIFSTTSKDCLSTTK